MTSLLNLLRWMADANNMRLIVNNNNKTSKFYLPLLLGSEDTHPQAAKRKRAYVIHSDSDKTETSHLSSYYYYIITLYYTLCNHVSSANLGIVVLLTVAVIALCFAPYNYFDW